MPEFISNLFASLIKTKKITNCYVLGAVVPGAVVGATVVPGAVVGAAVVPGAVVGAAVVPGAVVGAAVVGAALVGAGGQDLGPDTTPGLGLFPSLPLSRRHLRKKYSKILKILGHEKCSRK